MNDHAIVVGASSGIGAAIGVELRRRGWVVSGLARRAAPGASADRARGEDIGDRALSQQHRTRVVDTDRIAGPADAESR